MRRSNYPLYETDRVDNLKELLSNCAARYTDRIAFQYRHGSGIAQVSFQQFKQDVEGLGTAFLQLGLRNRHIAVLGENSYEWITTYFAATGSSNVIVPVDPELPPQEMKNILQGSDSTVLVYSLRFAGFIPDLVRQVDKLECLISMEAAADTNTVKSYPRLLELGRQLLEQGDRSFTDNPIDNHGLAAIIYTSGTTGVSKGVMLSQYNMASNVVASAQHLTAGESSLLVLPLHHTFGWTAGVLCMLHIGARICINNSLKNLTRDMLLFQPTQMCLVPLYLETMYKRVWANAHKQGKELLLKLLIGFSDDLLKLGIDKRERFFDSVLFHFGGRLRLVICGGAPLDPKYVKGFRELGIAILNGYGLTECSPCVTSNRNEYYRDDSIGLPLPGVEVKINDPDSEGEGEIWVKGPNVMLGYYKNPAATTDTMAGEWLKTGDIGKIDQDGFLYITGRIKNIIKLSSGINIYPEELEALIADIPYVKDVLVYAHTEAGHMEPRLTAEVLLDSDYIGDNLIKNPEERLEKAIDALNKSLPYYKKIRNIQFRETEFEKTTTRKIKRFKIVPGQ
ncbi:MAG: AMP-binding protein [Syntrophomonadaceae bacterium]